MPHIDNTLPIPNIITLHSLLSGNPPLRPSLRQLTEPRPLEISIASSTEYGHIEVKLGETYVSCKVSAQITSPYEDRPFEGTFAIGTEITPMCSPAFTSGGNADFSTAAPAIVPATAISVNNIDSNKEGQTSATAATNNINNNNNNIGNQLNMSLNSASSSQYFDKFNKSNSRSRATSEDDAIDPSTLIEMDLPPAAVKNLTPFPKTSIELLNQNILSTSNNSSNIINNNNILNSPTRTSNNDSNSGIHLSEIFSVDEHAKWFTNFDENVLKPVLLDSLPSENNKNTNDQ